MEQQRGFSLIEMIIAMGLLTGLALMAMTLNSNQMRTVKSLNDRFMAQKNLQEIQKVFDNNVCTTTLEGHYKRLTTDFNPTRENPYILDLEMVRRTVAHDENCDNALISDSDVLYINPERSTKEACLELQLKRYGLAALATDRCHSLSGVNVSSSGSSFADIAGCYDEILSALEARNELTDRSENIFVLNEEQYFWNKMVVSSIEIVEKFPTSRSDVFGLVLQFNLRKNKQRFENMRMSFLEKSEYTLEKTVYARISYPEGSNHNEPWYSECYVNDSEIVALEDICKMMGGVREGGRCQLDLVPNWSPLTYDSTVSGYVIDVDNNEQHTIRAQYAKDSQGNVQFKGIVAIKAPVSPPSTVKIADIGSDFAPKEDMRFDTYCLVKYNNSNFSDIRIDTVSPNRPYLTINTLGEVRLHNMPVFSASHVDKACAIDLTGIIYSILE